MKLVDFIQADMEQLLDDWIEAAVKITPELEGADRSVLQDHAQEMLNFICKDMQCSQTDRESARKALGKNGIANSIAASDHGSDRHDHGLSMLQMIEELRALRARVLQAWGEARQGLEACDITEIMRFNEGIDQMIAESVESYTALKSRELRLLEAMLKASPDPAAIFSADDTLLYLNAPMAELAGTSVLDAIGRTPLELDLSFARELVEAITETRNTGQFQCREFHHYSPSGREVYFDSHLVPVFDDDNAVEAVAKTSRDVTERKLAELDSWRGANFDSLTGLPNRRLFFDRLQQTLLEADRHASSFAVLFIDLDGFKQINDRLGHETGDHLLVQVAQRLSNTIRAMDTAARIGGDEFTVILKETGREGAKEAAKGIVNSLEQAFEVDSQQVQISCSIGLTISPDDDSDVNGLIHKADLAMYVAKGQEGQQVQAFEPWMAQTLSESEPATLNSELDDALSDSQMEVYYQPVIDMRTGDIAGAEALLRWNHPSRGLLTPDAFLSALEQNGTTDSISDFVRHQAAICACRWRDTKDEAFPVSINESPVSFLTRSLLDQWRGRLTYMSLDESWVTTELTASSFNNIYASGLNPVKNLASIGASLKLTITDLDLEPLSLLALQEFRIDSIKIGSALINEACQGGDPDRRLKALIGLAHALDIKVIGLGVETDEQLQCLYDADCDYAQGFLFSRPLREDDFEALLRRNRQQMAC